MAQHVKWSNIKGDSVLEFFSSFIFMLFSILQSKQILNKALFHIYLIVLL